MSFGQGYGVVFGGEPPIEVTSPLNSVGDQPYVFDFTDDEDGPFPGAWNFYVISTDASNQTTVINDPVPTDNFRVVDNVALFSSNREPDVGLPSELRGTYASPIAVLQGRNAEIAIAFLSPLELYDERAELFEFEMLVALRVQNKGTGFSYQGARVTARNDAGVWTNPGTLEIVVSDGTAVNVVATQTYDLPRPTDLWSASKKHELRLILVGDKATVSLSGSPLGDLTYTGVTAADTALPLVGVTVRNTIGGSPFSSPSILGVQLNTLRDMGRLGPAYQIDKTRELDLPRAGCYVLDIASLIRSGLIRHKGSRFFEVTPEDGSNAIYTESVYGSFVINSGVILRALEPFYGQQWVPCVPDLQHIRDAKEKS